MNDAVDRLFAGYCDSDICDAWYYVLCEFGDARSISAHWPQPWSVIWSVWRHYWIWHNEGVESLLMCDFDELKSFSVSLGEVEEPFAGDCVRELLAAVGPETLQDERFTLSEEFRAFAKEWNEPLRFHFLNVPESLAKFARKNRKDAGPVLEAMGARLRDCRPL